MEKTGTRINVPPFNSGKSDIVITGEKEGVATATSQIKQIYQATVSGCGCGITHVMCDWLLVEEELFNSVC